jgi:glyoxylate/hydroxypyruvate reductase
MSLLLVAQHRDMKPFRDAIVKIDPNIDVEIWPDVKHPERVQFAVAWNQPKNLFGKFENLKAVSSLGAGADHLFSDASIPDSIRFVRVVAPSLSSQMSDYVLTSVFNLLKRTDEYFRQQKRGEWKSLTAFSKDDLKTGIMGLGALGIETAQRLQINGFHVNGWSKSKKVLENIHSFSERELDTFLSETNILVCLLPLTPETEGILDLELFKKLKQPAFLINVARGEHLVEEDLIYSLDKGLIEQAVLDVFSQEPLPESHPFWSRDKITITPHIASITYPDEVADLLLENYKRLLSGMELLYEVDRVKGY